MKYYNSEMLQTNQILTVNYSNKYVVNKLFCYKCNQSS